MKKIPDRVLDRVLTKIAMGSNGCHVSMYSTASHGYPQVGWHEDGQRYVTLCHLALWRGLRGPIPAGDTVDHKCKLKRCVRLDHLRVLPNLENARRTSGRDWPLGFCVQGHLDAEHWRPSGAGRVRGYCSACNAEAQRKYRAKSAAPL